MEVPLKDLLEHRNDSSSTHSTASVRKLHHYAMMALFSMYIARDPFFKIPDYAVQYFETAFTYQQETSVVTIKDDDALMKAIQYGSEQHMCDDNDNVILHCYCTVKNTYISDVDKQLNEFLGSSKRVVDKTVRKVQLWMTKMRKSHKWHKSNRWNKSDTSEGVSRHFVDRIIHYLASSVVTQQENEQNQPKRSIMVTSKIASALVGKISSAVGKIAPLIHRLNDTFVDDDFSVSVGSISPSVFETINKSFSNLSSKSSVDSLSPHMKLPGSPGAIEIVFDCQESIRTPAEWNLFFTVPGMDNSLKSLSNGSSSNDGCILIDDEDVISLDESSVSNEFETCDNDSIQSEFEDLDSYSYASPSKVVANIDVITCPSDEERSMDGVMVQGDADVSGIENSSVESWTDLCKEIH